MQDHFGGVPVTKQNLSEWRQGGWLDWQRQQEALIRADRLAELLAVSPGHLLRDATNLPAGSEKTRAVLGAAEQLIRLRQTDRDRERASREAEEWTRQ